MEADSSPNQVVTAVGNGSALIRFDGVPGKTYRIEYQEVLEFSEWQILGNATADDSGFFEYMDSPPEGVAARRYRSICP